MKILKSTRSAFNRQIAESVMIQQKRKGNIIMNAKAEYNRCALPRLAAKLGEKDMEKWREEDRREAAEEATIEEKIRMRKKEKARNRMEASRRMEAGQPKKKKQRMDKEEEGQAPATRTGGGGEVPPVGGLVQQRPTPMPPTPQAIPSRRELPTATPTKKRKVMKAEMQQQSEKIRINADIKRYISCKRWKDEEEREKGASDSGQQHTINLPISPPQESSEAFARIGSVTDEVSPKKLKTGESHQPGPAVEPLLGGVRGERGEIERGPEGSESGTGTGGGGEAPPVGGLIQEEVIQISKEIVRELETRWSTNKPGIEKALCKVMGWTDDQTDLRINLMGWLATKTDEQIQQEAVEMVSALETVAHTRNITQMGEDIMTDVVRLCTVVISREEDIMTTRTRMSKKMSKI